MFYNLFQFNFVPGYLLIPVTAFQLFVPCLMSTILKTKGEDLYQNIYFMSWRLMSIADQKSIQLVLQYAALPKQLTTGVKVLNMETFVEVFVYY